MKKTTRWKRILAIVLTALMVLCNQTILFADETVQDTEQETETYQESQQDTEQESDMEQYQNVEESEKDQTAEEGQLEKDQTAEEGQPEKEQTAEEGQPEKEQTAEEGQPEKDQTAEGQPETKPEQDASKETQEPTTENKTVYYIVRFLGKDGNEITSQRIAAGQSATAPAAPDVDGYRFNGWDKKFDNVTADLDVQAIYVKIGDKVTYTINYQFSDGTAASQPWVAQLEVGTEYSNTIASPEITGFKPDKLSVEFSGTVEVDKTITVTYSGAEIEYTVQHMLQNAENDEYTLDTGNIEKKTGTVGLMTAAKEKTTYDGFTARLPISQATINADGSTVVNVYYERNIYRLIWDTDGGSYEQPVDIRYGASIGTPDNPNPTKLGYTFKKWEGIPEDGKMPSHDLIVKAIWEENQKAQYKVIHWQESLQAPGTYEVAQDSGGNAAIETKTGKVGDVISYSPKSYEGFKLNSEKSSGDVTITSDGTAVKNVYYDRGTYNIYFYVVESRDWWGRPSWQEDESLRITARYGEDVSAQWNDAAHCKYLWAIGPGANTYYTLMANMPADNIKLYASEPQTGKKITYYIEGLDGKSQVYAKFDAGSRMKLTDEDKMPIDGFSFHSWNKSGSNLWLYYTRNSYTITFQNCTGVNDLSVKFEAPLNNLEPADGSVGKPTNVESDYTFAGWYTSPSCEDGTEFNWSGTMPSHTITLYAKWQAPIYTVTFETNGGSPIDQIHVEKHQALGNIPETVKENDEFLGWYTDPGLTHKYVESLQIVKDITLYAKWKNTNVYTYYVVAVTRDKDGNETELDRSEGSVVQNGTANVTAPKIDGYYPKETSKSVIVTKNEQEIIFVYEPVAEWSYTIRYVDTDEKDIAEQVTVRTRNTVETVVYKAITGYQLTSEPVVQAEKGKTETVIFRYTTNKAVYIVKHYKQKPDGSYATPETETKEAAAIGTWVTAEPKGYTGYTCITDIDKRSGAVKKGLVLEIYYNRVDFTVGDYTGKYDGIGHTATFTGAGIEGDTYYYKTEGGEWTSFDTASELPQYVDAGSYQISVKVVNDGAKSAPKTATVLIQPREITLTSGSDQKVYDGKPLTKDEVNITGDGFVEGEGVTWKVTGSQTDVGTSKNAFTYSFSEGTKEQNYKVTKVEGNLTVVPSEDTVTVTIKENSGTEKYDGTEKTVTGYEVISISDPKYLETDFAFEGNAEVKGTDAGTYNMELKQEDFTNINRNFKNVVFVIEDGTLTITKRNVTLTSADDSKCYDGTPLTNDKITVTGDGFAEGESVTCKVTGSQTEVGSSRNEFTYELNKGTKERNYIITPVFGTLTVSDKDVQGVITKTHTGEKFRVNDQVTFTITVKNIYAEPQTITISEINGVTFDGQNVFENVEPGAEVTAKAVYTITQADVDNGSFINTATALFSNEHSYIGTDTVPTEKTPDPEPIPNPTPTPVPASSVSIEKTADQKEGGYAAGDIITYTIRVVNNGEQQLANIQVSDPLTGLNETIPSLRAGEEKIFTTTYTVTEQDVLAGKIVNVATVKGTDENGKTVENETTKELVTEQKNSHLTVTKTTTSTPADGKAYSVGEKITYIITVTNDGNVTVTGVQVTDELTGNVGDLAWNVDSLAPGESREFTAEYTVTKADAQAGKVHNVAAAQGNSNDPEKPDVPVTPGETEDPVNPEVTPTVTPKPSETPEPSITPTPDITQAPAVTKTPSDPSTPVNNGTTTKTAVKTGDTTPVGAFVGLFAAAAIIAGAAVYFKRRKNSK